MLFLVWPQLLALSGSANPASAYSGFLIYTSSIPSSLAVALAGGLSPSCLHVCSSMKSREGDVNKRTWLVSKSPCLNWEHIMYPKVHIALRMSGHLRLGVVRIYSKKVNYLYQDYNFFLITMRKAFASVEVNLPEDATHTPFDSVTLPKRSNLMP
ncbi:unnamed protein product [Camellia sinensis]